MSVGGEDWRRTLLVTAVLCYRHQPLELPIFYPTGTFPMLDSAF